MHCRTWPTHLHSKYRNESKRPQQQPLSPITPDRMKSTKVQTLGKIWWKYWNIWIENTFACIRIIVLGIYRTSFQHNLYCFINACVHVVKSTCNELLTIPKQFIPEFLSILLQYSLKCKVTVWRQAVSKLDRGFDVHLFEAAINLELKGVLCSLGNQSIDKAVPPYF